MASTASDTSQGGDIFAEQWIVQLMDSARKRQAYIHGHEAPIGFAISRGKILTITFSDGSGRQISVRMNEFSTLEQGARLFASEYKLCPTHLDYYKIEANGCYALVNISMSSPNIIGLKTGDTIHVVEKNRASCEHGYPANRRFYYPRNARYNKKFNKAKKRRPFRRFKMVRPVGRKVAHLPNVQQKPHPPAMDDLNHFPALPGNHVPRVPQVMEEQAPMILPKSDPFSSLRKLLLMADT